jgi:PAS domain-containing protein
LEARSRRSETVIASSGEAIWSGSLDGTIESWDPAAERLYGYTESEIVGRSAALLRPTEEVEDFTREHRVVGVVSVVRDLGEHNRTAARLAEAQSRFVGAFEAASTGMALVALDGRFLAVNPALRALLARDRDTLLTSSMGEVTHVEDLAASRK